MQFDPTSSLMQFDQMAILSYELRMLEQSKQHPPIICIYLFIYFYFFHFIIIYLFLFLFFYFIFGTSFIVCGWIPGLLCLTKRRKKKRKKQTKTNKQTNNIYQ